MKYLYLTYWLKAICFCKLMQDIFMNFTCRQLRPYTLSNQWFLKVPNVSFFNKVLVVNSQGEVSRMNAKKEVVMKGNINNYFKLGQEGKYRVYHNQYATNSFALNKHQHREDHDKRRHLSHKFCLTPAGEFKWNGSVHGSKVLTISTLRLTIIQLENNIPASFLHPNWASHR